MYSKLICSISLIMVLGMAGYVSAAEVDVNIPATGPQKPILDGVVDDIWSLSTKEYLTITVEGTDPDSQEDCSGSWQALWDSEYLYVLVDVNDEVLIQDSADDQGWNDDRIEIFIDGDNSKGEATDSINDYQYCFRWNNGMVETPYEHYISPDSLEGVEYAVATVDDGYLFEVALPWSTLIGGPQRAGQLIGIDIAINDDDDGGDRDTQICWHIPETPPHSPIKWGTAYLVPEFPEKTFNPEPLDGQTDVPRDAILGWTEGLYADKHNVYLGTDVNNVNEANIDDPRGVLLSLNQDDTTYDPVGLLDYNQTYYWRIDEVNDTEPDSPWKGIIWSFTVVNFIIVEDFEDYNDYPPNEIFNTWIDGWGDPTNGATSGYPAPDFVGGEHYLDDDLVHGGLFSFPLLYDNSAGISEATKTINTDWTVDDVLTLTLFYFGDASNAVEPMYVALNGDVAITNPDAKAALDNEWNQWDILLQDFTDMGADLTNVNSMSIGFGNKNNPTAGGSGLVFFDDIRLYRSPPIEVEPEPEAVDPGTANLVAYYDLENDVQDSSGHGRHATAQNDPGYVSGPTGFGTAISLDGLNDYVELPIGSVINTLTDCTITAWVNWSGEGDAWQRIFDFGTPPASADEDPQIYMFLTGNAGGGSVRFAMTISDNSDEDQTTASGVLPSRWHHVAVTIDSANMVHTLYLDGKVVGQNTEARFTPSDLGETTQNWIGRSQWSADPYFGGVIDEFRIYNRVLSDAELFYLMGR